MHKVGEINGQRFSHKIFLTTSSFIIILIGLFSHLILFYNFYTIKKHLVLNINMLCLILSLNLLSIAMMFYEKFFNIYILLSTFLIQAFMIFPFLKLIKIGRNAIIKQSSSKSMLLMEIISLASFLGYISGTIIYSIFEELISLNAMLIIFQFVMFAIILILVGNSYKAYLIKKYIVRDEELFIE